MVSDTTGTGSPDDVNRLWHLMARRGIPPATPYRVQFSIACPTRALGEFLVQYLEHSAAFGPAVLQPAVSGDGEEYWDLDITSYEGALSRAFLLSVCSTVHAATARFGCRLYAWGKAQGPAPTTGGLTSA